jgi:peptide/nickel transport system permease protein
MGEPVLEAPEPDVERPRRLSWSAWLCVGWIGGLVLVAALAPVLAADPITEGRRVVEGCGDGSGLPLYDPNLCTDLEAKRNQRLEGVANGRVPHLAGVDGAGRDTLSQIVAGTRNTLTIAVVSIALATVVGGALGMVSGYFRRGTGAIVDTLFDIMIAFPPLILAMLIVTYFAAEEPARRVPGIIFAATVVAIPIMGRIARASTLSWASRDFIIVAESLGASSLRILVRELLPNVAPALMSISLLGVGVVVVTEAGLSLIGLGVPAGDVSWGSVMAAGSADFRNYPHMVFVPAAAIVITVAALNFLGDAVRIRFDIRLT